jgi:hypothetical protein
LRPPYLAEINRFIKFMASMPTKPKGSGQRESAAYHIGRAVMDVRTFYVWLKVICTGIHTSITTGV